MDSFQHSPPEGTPSAVAVAGHPLHPMAVTFPIAFLVSALGSDLMFWHLGDPFWARVSLWLLGAGTVTGTLAGIVGAVEVLAIRGIRRRAASWSHSIAAVMLLAVATANWFLRIDEPEAHVIPLGLYLSGLGAILVLLAGWLGGTLVFEHKIGTVEEDDGD